MSSTRWLLLLPFVASALALVHAQTSPGQKQNPAAPDFSKEAYVIERFYTRVTSESDGTGTRELTAEVKMLADAGVKAFAVLSFTYTSANEVVDIDYVRVRKPDGTIVKTPDYNIQDMPGEVTRTAPLYSDIHEKHVAVKGLAVGDVLEYLVRFRVVKPEVAGHFWYEYEFTKQAIVRDEQLELNVPKDKYVKVVSPAFKPETKDDGSRRIYRWTHQNLIVEQTAPDEVPRRIPPNPDVQVTTFASWEEVGRWYAGLQKDSLTVTPAIQAKAAELTKGLKSDDDKIHAIYNFVSLKYHYIGLDFGIGRYQPHAADDVLDNGYGDCKDKQTLLASLLKAAGIDAWPVLIHATRKLDSDVPSPAQFNHVIGVVPEGDKLVWLDTTPEVAPYGLLMLMLRGKEALVIPTGKAPVLMETPQNAPFPQVQVFSMEGKLDADGTFTGHAEQSYRGDSEVLLRIAFRQVPQSQYKEAVQRFSYGLNFRGDVSNVTLTSPDDTGKSFEVSYDYLRKNYSDWDNRQIGPPLPPIGLEMSKDSKKPHEPVVLGGVGELVYKAKVTLPASYSATVPANVNLVRPYAEYHATYSVESGVLSATRRVIIKKPEVELSSWEDYRDFGKAISDDENQYIRFSGGGGTSGTATTASADLDAKFQEGAQALEKRDFTRAEELLRRVISGDDHYHGAHFNLGVVLQSQGKMNDALVEYRKEQDVSPTDIRAYEVTATILTFMGRRDESVEEWRKVLKVDPKNHDAALKLSFLLTGLGRDVEAATVLDDAVKQSPDSPNLQMALGEALVRTGRAEQGVPHMSQAIRDAADPRGMDPGMLNDAAYLLAVNKTHLELAREYAEKVVAELDARSVEAAKLDGTDQAGIRLSGQFPAAWDTLGWVYFQMGDANRAENYVRAGWVLGQSSVAGDHLGQILEKLGRKQEAERAYEQALSTTPVYMIPWGPADQYVPAALQANRKNRDQIVSHYQKLTGRSLPPPVETKRLSTGEWTKTPSDELREARETKVTKITKAYGEAQFDVVFAPGKVEAVRFVQGEEQLKPMIEKLQTARYPITFPAGSTAKIVRRVQLSCNPSSVCDVEMLLPTQVTPAIPR